MKGRNFSIVAERARYITIDFVMCNIGFFLFNLFRYYALDLNEYFSYSEWDFIFSKKLILEQIFVPIGMIIIFAISGFYNHPIEKSRLSELNVTLASVLVASAIIFLALLINDTTGVKSRDYEVLLGLYVLLTGCVYFGRWLLTTIKIHNLRKRNWIYSTLIVGNSKESRRVYERLKNFGSIWVYNVVGFIRLPNEHNVDDGLKTWDWEKISEVCEEYKIDQIILALENNNDSQIMGILEKLFPLGIPVRIAPDTLSYVTGNIRLNDILGIPFIDLTSPRMSDFEKNIKRLFDITASIGVLIILSPLFLLLSIGVKLSSSGPVIYRQERMGKGHKPFKILKFRSMRQDAEQHGPMLSSLEDERVTNFGHFMRKYRLDELPQFWNVLIGEMSLVGPRPEREFYIEQIVKKAPYYGLIFQVRPGVTSWGMVKYGYASSVSQMVERSRYDLLYINNMSLSNDMKIMIYTVRTVVKGSGM